MRKSHKTSCLAFFLVVVAASPFILGMGKSPGGPNPIVNFYEVYPQNRCSAGAGGAPVRSAGTIYRGAAPGEPGLQYLQSQHFKTILNFQTQDEIQEEMDLIKKDSLALNEIPHSMNNGMGVNDLPDGNPDHEGMIASVADMRRVENFPEYVHCTHGQDRTGLIVALHRVFNECWSPEDAEAEWDQIEGWWHHLWQIPKHDYFHDVTNSPELRKYYEYRLAQLVPAQKNSPSSAVVMSESKPAPISAPETIMKEPGVVNEQ